MALEEQVITLIFVSYVATVSHICPLQHLEKMQYSRAMGNLEFLVIMLFVCIGVLYWKAIQQVLKFRKDRKWTGKFVISAAWLSLVSINVVLGFIRSIF